MLRLEEFRFTQLFLQIQVFWDITVCVTGQTVTNV